MEKTAADFTTESKPAASSEEDSGESLLETSLKADICIRNHVIAAMGVGLIPSSIVDIAGITAIEVKMICDLARIYNFPAPHRLITYKALISLVGSIGPVYVSYKMHKALKGIPLLGHAVYVGMLSITGGAAVYAVGKVFQIHFESGGTFLSKENSLIRDYFRKSYAQGKKVASGLMAGIV